MHPPPENERKREAALAALREAIKRGVTRADGQNNTRQRGAPFMQRRLAEHALIDEITSAAECVAGARDWNGEPVYRTEGVWRVLATVARSTYCLAIADLARALRVRRQVAHRLAHEAARARVVELAPNPDDKRILQAFVTPKGRAELAAARTTEEIWLATLLNGLGDNELKATLRVVRVIRQRLGRDARELERHKAELERREAELARRNALLAE